MRAARSAATSAIGSFEAARDTELTGIDGQSTEDVSADGQVIPGTLRDVVDAVDGRDVTLTLDLDLQTYVQQKLEKAKANFANVGTVPFGYGNPLYNNTGCFTENTPAATCNGNTREVRQITAGIYDTIYQGNYGTLKAGVQYSYTQRFAFAGVGGAPKTDDNIVMTQIRYYPF